MLQTITPPIPLNEQERLKTLAEFDIDYSTIESNFKDLALLAAKIAGTEISLVNLIDSVTQWTVSNYGYDIIQMPRNESVCQYTISTNHPLEIMDLSADERFKDRPYVNGPLNLKYYMGIPLTTAEGYNIGALCVVDSELKSLSEEQKGLLKIVANEVVNRLKAIKTINQLKQQLVESKEIQKKVAHDIRGPIAGIIGLTGLINQQGESNNLKEVLECVALIQKSGKSILDLADQILYGDKAQPLKIEAFNLHIFKEKLECLYASQAKNKNVSFEIKVNERNQHIPFLKNKLLQITGNLISSAMKFSSKNGSVKVELDLAVEATNNLLKIRVQDNGVVTDENFGLTMVKQLVESLNGTFSIQSAIEKGTLVEISIPQHYLPHVSFDDSL